MQRRLPMALAETASIFCETLVVAAGLDGAAGAERLALLDVDLQGATQVVVDIHSRLLFETEVFRRRRRSARWRRRAVRADDSTPSEQAYGDGLDRRPAAPVHVGGEAALLRLPLLQLAVHLRPAVRPRAVRPSTRSDPERFRAGYDDLLAPAGMADAADLGRRFGIDVRDEAFWTASLDVLRGRIADYEALAAAPARPVP